MCLWYPDCLNNNDDATLEVFTAVNIQDHVFWVMTLDSVVVGTNVSKDLPASIFMVITLKKEHEGRLRTVLGLTFRPKAEELVNA
jgi:hypothetical protein